MIETFGDFINPADEWVLSFRSAWGRTGDPPRADKGQAHYILKIIF